MKPGTIARVGACPVKIVAEERFHRAAGYRVQPLRSGAHSLTHDGWGTSWAPSWTVEATCQHYEIPHPGKPRSGWYCGQAPTTDGRCPRHPLVAAALDPGVSA